MHKGVKLLVLFLFFADLFLISCHKSTTNALRIVEINNGSPLAVDVLDEWSVTYPDDPEPTLMETYNDYYVDVEVAYVELGTGMPTYPTPYTAKITRYTVDFDDVTPYDPDGERHTPIDFDGIEGGCNFLIPADPEGRNTVTQAIKIVPFEMLERYEDDLSDGLILNAKVTLIGKDEISDKEVRDEAYITLDVSDYEDDPNTQYE